MKLVTRNDLENWAERIDSKGEFPYLISRLVRATTPTTTQADIPSGSSAYIGGWDGVVICEKDTSHVPKDTSLWEFGTEADNKGKADADYDKRTKDPLGQIPEDCVFIFVTLRFWKQKDKWIKAKKKEGIWKDVRVYDSSILEQWLDNALSVARWLSGQIGSYPFDGIMTADEYWDEWSVGPNGIVLLPEVVTSGRELEQKQLLAILQDTASVKGVKASTKHEAIAFIIATAKQFPKNESERFFAKSLVVDTEGNFRGIRINTATPLNLIPRFEDPQPFYKAAGSGHHVLVPLGADDTFNQDVITLQTIDRDGQVNSLIQSGLSKEDAEKYSKEAGRNITILRKLLGFPSFKAKWLETENLREIIPVLILGRWNEKCVGDIEILEKLSGFNYEDYVVTLGKWLKLEESPIIKIGETWRLTSPLDFWTKLGPLLTKKDFKSLEEAFSIAFKDCNPVIEPKDPNDFATIYNKPRKFSNWSREGLTQSLILIGQFGEGLLEPILANPQLWVDRIIHDLLQDASGELWISINHELPLISEASPTSFLDAASNSLSKEKPEIMDMFVESDGFLHSISNHTGLLWALEGLAWLPEYLGDSTSVLLTLARLDPGGSLSNRPKNSLAEIFKPWHYQTLATYDERMEILKHSILKEPQSGWQLLISMLPDHLGVAQPTHKMRWRIFNKNTNLTYTYQEIWNTHTYVTSLLLDLFDGSETKFSQLIIDTPALSYVDRQKILDWAEVNYSKVQQTRFDAWHEIRQLLSHHRSHPDTDWALGEEELLKFEALYDKLKPTDKVKQYIWLFNDHWPAFPEGALYIKGDFEKRHDQQQKKVDEARIEGLKIIIDEIGLKEALELRKSVKESWILGDILATIGIDEADLITVCQCLNDDSEGLRFIKGFISRKSIIEDLNWIIELFGRLHNLGFDNRALANLLIPINQTKSLWDFILSLDPEIQTEYWQNMYPHFYPITTDEKVMGIEMLMKYGRFWSAIDVCAHFANELPTTLISKLLKLAGTEESSEERQPRGYEIGELFEILDKRDDLDHATLVNLEWIYLPVLDSYRTKRNPKVLQQELTKSPAFFVDVLKWIYIPKDKSKLEEERKGVSDEAIQNRAKLAYHLLHSWKVIPGVQSDNSIDEEQLNEWIAEARRLAEIESRLEVADMHIGKILAAYPENVSQWPQEIIFKAIETIASDVVDRNYSSEMFNKRGSSSRGPFDGGDIERNHSKYFAGLHKDYKNQFPRVSKIFKQLSDGYLEQAKRMDENAERDKLEY